MVGEGDFIEVYCSCSLEICERRDVNGMYAKARRGDIPHFTGISSPYEIPDNPEIIVDTGHDSLEECADKIIKHLQARKLLIGQ